MTGREYTSGDKVYSTNLDNLKEAAKQNYVLSGGLVAQNAGGADMSVDVSGGGVQISGANFSFDDGNNVVIAGSSLTLNRHDIITVSGANVSYVSGSFAENPFPPELPEDNVLLARVEILSGATTITDARITDERIIGQDKTYLIGEGNFPEVMYSDEGIATITGDTGVDQTIWSKTFAAGKWVQGDTMKIITRALFSRTLGATDTNGFALIVGASADFAIDGGVAPTDTNRRYARVEWREWSADADLGFKMGRVNINDVTTTDIGSSQNGNNGDSNFGGAFTVKSVIVPVTGTNYSVKWSVSIEKIKGGVG